MFAHKFYLAPQASSAAPAVSHFTTRALDESDGPAFGALRLKSLQAEGHLLTGSAEQEGRWSVRAWGDACRETADQCYFGRFANDVLVGTMYAKNLSKLLERLKQAARELGKLPEEIDNALGGMNTAFESYGFDAGCVPTALWGSTYIEQSFRRSGFAAPLYKATEEWTHAKGFKAVAFCIHADNHRAAEIQEKRGAILIGTQDDRLYANGKTARANIFLRHLAPAWPERAFA